MSDIDRVFARMGGGQPSSNEQRELRRIPKRGGAAGSRVVEVVRLPSRGAPAGRDPARTSEARLRAAVWEDGFPAKTMAPAAEPEPVAAEAPEPVTHVMPAWEPTRHEQPEATTAEETPAPESPRRRQAAPSRAEPEARRVADPFDASDDGANCLRCGYMVEPARERRGLMTCAACG
jgi:hypothetical protein